MRLIDAELDDARAKKLTQTTAVRSYRTTASEKRITIIDMPNDSSNVSNNSQNIASNKLRENEPSRVLGG